MICASHLGALPLRINKARATVLDGPISSGGVPRPGTVSAARILVTEHGIPGLSATLGPEQVVLSAGAVLDSIRAAFRPG